MIGSAEAAGDVIFTGCDAFHTLLQRKDRSPAWS